MLTRFWQRFRSAPRACASSRANARRQFLRVGGRRSLRLEQLEDRSLLTWIGALSGATIDAAHNYNNPANWAGGVIDDSFNGVNFAADTTIYFSASRATTAAGMNFNYNGAANLTLMSSSATTQTITLNGGISGDFGGANNRTVTIGATANPVNISLPGGPHSVNVAGSDTLLVAGVISNTGTLTKTGSGTLVFAGNNTYSGTTTIAAGTLRIGNNGTTGTLGTANVVNNAALVFQRQAGNLYSPANVISGTGNVTVAGGQVNLTGNCTYTGTTTINFNASLFLGVNTTTGSLNPVSAIINNGRFGSQRSNTITQGADFASVISGSGGVTFASSLGGTMVLNGANTYTGTPAVPTGSTGVAAGTIQFNSIQDVGGGASALGAPTTVAIGTIAVGSNGIATPANLAYVGAGSVTNRVINLIGNTPAATAGLSQSGTGLLKFTSNITSTATASKSLILSGSTGGSAEISGAIQNSATATTSLTKSGTGTWTLSGANTYTGTTTINGGTLRVMGPVGNIASSATTVNSSGTLAGTGTTGAVAVASGGTLAPG
jgi:autotransporter-associated beta strand protein